MFWRSTCLMAYMVYFSSTDDTSTISIGLWLLSHAQFISVELGAWQYLIIYNMILKKKEKKAQITFIHEKKKGHVLNWCIFLSVSHTYKYISTDNSYRRCRNSFSKKKNDVGTRLLWNYYMHQLESHRDSIS